MLSAVELLSDDVAGSAVAGIGSYTVPAFPDDFRMNTALVRPTGGTGPAHTGTIQLDGL